MSAGGVCKDATASVATCLQESDAHAFVFLVYVIESLHSFEPQERHRREVAVVRNNLTVRRLRRLEEIILRDMDLTHTMQGIACRPLHFSMSLVPYSP